MTTSVDEIAALYQARKTAAGADLARMKLICDVYNSDIVLPLPELGKNEKAAVANLLAQGLDQTAMRVADPVPNVEVPPQREGVKRWVDKASEQRRALLGHWEQSSVKRKMRRRARWFVGYGAAPVLIRPLDGYACWELRSPLATFPAASADPDELHPDDCIFQVHRRYGWLKDRYGDQMRAVHTGANEPKRDDLYEVVEYVDADEWVTVCFGRAEPYPHLDTGYPTKSMAVQLERVVNSAGVPCAVVPGRVSLDRRQGQFDSIVGMYQTQAKLAALSVIATQKGIFGDDWLVAHPNEEPEIVATPDPYDGRPGIVKGGTLQHQVPNPNFQTPQTMQMLETAMRQTAGIPLEFGGSSSSGVRTAKRGGQLLSAVVDFPVAEAQEMLAAALEVESRVAIATEKAYFADMPRSFFVSWKGARGKTDFTPAEMWDGFTDVKVAYSWAGTDTASMVIDGMQRVGGGTMAKRTFMEKDPLVDDVETELAAVRAEGLHEALMASIQAGLADPQGPWTFVDAAEMIRKVASGTELPDAVVAIDKAKKDEQAAAAQGEIDPMDPAAQLGIEAPADAGLAIPDQAAGPSAENLASMLRTLTTPQRVA